MQALKLIYGLKQTSRSWNKRFDEEIKRFGFTQNLVEPCVYQKASGSNVTFLILYVDDIYHWEINSKFTKCNDYLGKCFDAKDLGGSSIYLESKIYRVRLDMFSFWMVGAADWKSSTESTTAMSATEAEYIAASEAAMEVVWIRKFISGLDDNLADPFTKALPNEKLTQHARSMGLRLASSFM
ncbi:retrotransposon protein, putative, ty1-copia subclass [Tanacetum coccineum]